MNMDKKRIEGPFVGAGCRYPEYLNKCGSCGEQMGIKGGKEDKEYRITWSEELFKKSGGREGRTYYCIPCGEKIIAVESKEANKRHKKNQEQRIEDARGIVDSCFAIISPFCQKLLAQKNVVLTKEDYKKIKDVQ